MNPDTAKIIDRLVTSRDGLKKLDIADYAMIRDAREAMADAANALTNYAKTFMVIQETDQAAAPHMLPAPEGVSEAEKRGAWLNRSDEEWDALFDAISTVNGFSVGRVLTDADVAALHLVQKCEGDDEEAATDAYSRGHEDGLRKRGGDELVALTKRADDALIEKHTERTMRRLAESRAALNKDHDQ